MNFLKSVLPRLVGQPAQDALASLDISLTDKNGNMRDIIQVYSEVAQKVQDVSDMERISVVEGLAGKYHNTRMQAFLDQLAQADGLYSQMHDTSVNSAGSAERENEQYLK
ncbi:phage tail tape measure protein, partial [Streptomyces sp. NPDC057927]